MSSKGDSNKVDWGSWIPIVVLFVIPTVVTKIISLVLLVTRLTGMTRQEKDGYRRKAKETADHVRSEARRVFHQDGQRTGQDQGGWQAQYDAQNQQRAQQKAEWQRQYQARQDQTWGQGQNRSQNRSQGSGASAAGPGNGAADSYSQGMGQTGTNAPKQPKEKKVKTLKKGSRPGTGLVIAGGIVSGVFLIGFTATVVELLTTWAASDISGVVATAVFLAGGLAMLFSGIGKNRKTERYTACLNYIGANREVDLARMAANLGVSERTLCKDLRKMLAKGLLPTGYIDLAEGKLFLTEMGYREQEPKAAEPEPEEVPAIEREDEILREIRQVNDDIPDEVMSGKIDRIEEITRKILAYQKQHPDRAGQLRTFLNYYLPTTLKILRAYAQLDAQGIEGENISAAKARIEGMMDQVVAGFEKQLDKLFQDDALDIASDVQVLENMLKKDGLSDGQGMTLGGL